MLTDILTKDVVRLDVEGLTTPEEVIHFSGQLLVNSGKVKETYIEKMEEAFHDLGPYMVMAPGIAMPHARPSGDVSEPCISSVSYTHLDVYKRQVGGCEVVEAILTLHVVGIPSEYQLV